MGPTIIFDKSFLESINPDEAVWLDNFFLSNITPLFFVETLADLEKEVRKGRTPEAIVGSLAYRTPEMGKINIHHRTLLEGELSGVSKLDMEYGRPHIGGGRTVVLDGKMGVFFQASPEEEALSRWQNYEFLDLERTLAKQWRKGLAESNLEESYKRFQSFFPTGKPKDLAGVKKFVDLYLSVPDQESILIFGLILEGVAPRFQAEILARWKSSGKPLIGKFMPYFAYIVSVDLFFYLAISADLIGRGRPSHKIDLAYLYYLPFCMVFTSNDNLHKQIVPFFLRGNQSFISGLDLKAGLSALDGYFDGFSDEIKKRGVMSFAFYPPHSDSFLVTRLWDQYMSPGWRKNEISSKRPSAQDGKKITDEIRRFEKEGVPVLDESRVESDIAHSTVIKRMVRARKGKWDRFPPEAVNRQKNKDGEWEDIPSEGK